MTATPIQLNIPDFRALFPAFSDAEKFPDIMLEMKWEFSIIYVSDVNYGRLRDRARELAIYTMLAHLLQLDIFAADNDGQGQSGVLSAATIDKISVTLVPPPVEDAWEWWLQQTSYGSNLLAMLSAISVGGFSVGGGPERAAFRSVGGRFGFR